MLRGFLMGGADIIPGVSGGTVALILGIYERLVTAISHFGLTLLVHLKRRQWSQAARHVNLRFLVALGSGIFCAIAGLAKLMHYLLTNHQAPTQSLFFGLILASSFLVGRMVLRWNVTSALGTLAGAGFAFWLVGLPATEPQGYAYLFLCGMIAICAMILPGISGAFILIILGKYYDMVGHVSSLFDGTADASTFLALGVFVSGCVLGLIGFSKFLRWLLVRHESMTMAVLCGFIFGSLRKIWPFKKDFTIEHLDDLGLSQQQIEAIRSEPQRLGELLDAINYYENILPEQFSGEVVLCLGLVILAIVFVFVLDRFAGTGGKTKMIPPKNNPVESDN